MKRPPTSLIVGLTVFVLYSLWAPPVYFAEEIEGRIVDSQTGVPIEGASVVAEWELYGVNFASAGSGGTMNIIEATTDADGRYRIPRWGPSLRPPWGYLLERSPQFIFFKAGYYLDGGGNNHDNPHQWIRTSEYDGEVVRLYAFDGDFQRLADSFFNHDPWLGGGCAYKCPRYVFALSKESARLKQFVPPNVSFLYPREIRHMSERSQAYFNRYGK